VSGATEPSTWQVSATDSATALQAAGSVGVTNYLSSAATNPPVTMSLTSFVAKPTSVPTNQPPTAAFTSSCTNLACSFDATASSDPDGTIAGEPVCRRLAAYRGRRHVHRYLRSTSSTDTDLVLVISIDKTPDSNGVYFTVTPRGVSSTTEYRARVRINSAVALRLTRLVAGTETVLVNEMTLAGLTYTAGTSLTIRVQAVGNGTTTLRARVWKTSTTEPSTWQASITDSTAALQAGGSVGVTSYLSSGATVGPTVLMVRSITARPTAG
jgi:hypothetical protein